MSRLWIAEKRSLAEDIVAALPGTKSKGNGYLQAGDDVVTWLAGHVLEPFMPDDYDPSFKNWEVRNDPIVPEKWQLKVNEDKRNVFGVVEKLLCRHSVVVHAGDPDREGQLIVDEVLRYVGFNGRVFRLWFQGQDAVNMRRAIASLADNETRRDLSAAALERQAGDWIEGVNLTRQVTVIARNKGFHRQFSIGRVVLAALRLLVMRDRTIENFVPIPYFTVDADLGLPQGGKVSVAWQPAAGGKGVDEKKRCIEQSVAEHLVAAATGAKATVSSFKVEPKKEGPPLPFDLGFLSTVVGRRKDLRLRPKQVLEVVQSLYEKKLVTYPRTESRYIPEAQFDEVPAVLAAVAANSPEHARLIEKAEPKRRSRAWNDAKTKSHHAIIPTQHRASTASLSSDEKAIYDLIVRMYIAQFYPDFEFERTAIEVELAGETFATSGRVPKIEGWRPLLEKEGKQQDEPELALPRLTVGQSLPCEKAMMSARKTEPPPRYTENTLQEDMKNAHKFVTDEKMRALLKSEEDGKHPGIGTPATQPDIIAKLSRIGYSSPGPGETIISTPLGRMLIDVLPAKVSDIGLTALFEQHLAQIANGQTPPSAFRQVVVEFSRQRMREIAQCAFPAPSPEIPAEFKASANGKSGGRRRGSRSTPSSGPKGATTFRLSGLDKARSPKRTRKKNS